MPNLIQNPSFEMGLLDWRFVNASIADDNPLEGTAVARLGPGVSSLFQDVDTCNLRKPTFLLSFAVEAPDGLPGNLSVQVQWVDCDCKVLGLGLCLFIPSRTIFDQDGWLTIVAATERAPSNTEAVRITFSKSAGEDCVDFLDIDLVNLTAL